MPDLITKEEFETQVTTMFDAAFDENVELTVTQVKSLEDSIDEQVLNSHLRMFIKSILFYEVPEDMYQEILSTMGSRIKFVSVHKTDDGNINVEYECNIVDLIHGELRVFENGTQTCRMTLEYDEVE